VNRRERLMTQALPNASSNLQRHTRPASSSKSIVCSCKPCILLYSLFTCHCLSPFFSLRGRCHVWQTEPHCSMIYFKIVLDLASVTHTLTIH
jgi:hypothetical protein